MLIPSSLERKELWLSGEMLARNLECQLEISPALFRHHGGTIQHRAEPIGAASETSKLSSGDLTGLIENVR
jgi:hypothetical protein